MHLKKRTVVKAPHKAAPRHHEETVHRHEELHHHESRGLNASVRFFVDHVISVAVSSVARRQAEAARLALTGTSGDVLHILISTLGDGESFRFVAHSNDMCLFVGTSPSLYVVNHTPRELEHSIYLYMSERLANEAGVDAQIFRETGTIFELPVLEGSSLGGPRSLKPRAGAATG